MFVAENCGGSIAYVDPQGGNNDAKAYFEAALEENTMIERVDNLEPSGLIDECCTSRKRATS